MSDDDLLAEQRRYYAARAGEYEDWWFRRNSFALEPEAKARWDADVAETEAALAEFGAVGDVLELAAGTGLWTRHLARTADRVVAVDANAEPLELNRARTDGPVEYVVADLFAWEPEERAFDLCFFGYWLSHVPAARFEAFWQLVRSALRPGGRVFLVDSNVPEPRNSSVDHHGEVRWLQDGRRFRIVKHYWAAEELAARVAPLGFALDLAASTAGHILYGGGR